MTRFCGFSFLLLLAVGTNLSALAVDSPLAWDSLIKEPETFAGVTIQEGSARLTGSPKWSFLRTKATFENVEVAANLTIEKPASQFGFFGSSWSVWPDPKYADGGFDGAVLLRGSEESGFRVQLSHKYQQVTLVKWPSGGYVRSVPCEVKIGSPHVVSVSAKGNDIAVAIDGKEKFRFVDSTLPLKEGYIGVGVSSLATVRFDSLTVRKLDAPSTPVAIEAKHTPNFSVRTWVGGRPWVFDHDEPIMLLLDPKSSTINNVKLRPGYKPLLSWNSHWDIQNQGAFPEGTNQPGPATITGGGKEIIASWKSRQVKDRFETRTVMTVGWDDTRQLYKYDIDSELEVLPGEPFHFRYGFDFEHHTPLDPFQWQYLIMRREGGGLNHRPVCAFDPGPQMGLEAYHGARVWYGRHTPDFLIAPTVEYQIDPQSNVDPDKPGEPKKRQLNTAVCAAFYDTGVSFAAETAKPGTKIHVKYRYTGYPAEEAQRLFNTSTVYESPTLDPKQHFIFVDGWPKLTFSQFAPLSETWRRDKVPFHSGHNQRPRYQLAKNTGIGSGYAMQLGPKGYAIACLPTPAPVPSGRYIVTAMAKSINTHGPGGYLEVVIPTQNTGGNFVRHSGKVKSEERHYVGNGTFDWRPIGFVTQVPSDSPALAVGFGNEGTGNVLFAEVEFRRLADDEAIPTGILPAANTKPAPCDAAPSGAIADYRFREGEGLFVFDNSGGPFGNLELANLDFVKDEGHAAIKFTDNTSGRKLYPAVGAMSQYLDHKSYDGKQTTPVAIAGHHGGGFEVPALTISTWVKPEAEMKTNESHLVGVGARRFILMLTGQKAPYRLSGVLNVNDRVSTTEPIIEANRWQHVAMSCAPQDGQWRIRLFLDDKQVAEGVTKKFASPVNIPPSFVMGAEIFYLHHGYFRGLLGRTTVFQREVTGDELSKLQP